MVRSLRWRIQLWYGLLLAIVLIGFVAFVYLRLRELEFRRIDAELEGAANSLVAVLRGLPPVELEEPPPRRATANAADADAAAAERDAEIWTPWVWDGHGEWDESLAEPVLGAEVLPWQRSLVLPPGFMFRNEDSPYYFLVWQQGRGTIARSPFAPSPDEIEFVDYAPETAPLIYSIRDMRHAVQRGPAETFVVVARSIHREIVNLDHWLLRLAVVSLVIYAGAILGGGWLSKQALQPLVRMSQTAAAISAENLSQRIDATRIDAELAQLAETLNATFARLELAFTRQAAFTADASHELRTPLTTLLGRLELLLLQMPSGAKQPGDNSIADELRVCLRSAKRMKSLVEQLLLLAKADAGKLPLESQPFDWSPVVEECVELLAPLAAEKQVTLTTDLPSVEVVGDPGLLSQVVLNLVTNAIQNHRPGGSVRVELQTQPDAAVLSVSDDGPGIPPADRDRVFERFYRADQSRSREAGGNGLGLAITKSIVVAHRGEISFESQPGLGTIFRVRLPLRPLSPFVSAASGGEAGISSR